MKAQELPMNTVVLIGLGLLFFVVLFMAFANIGGLGEILGLIGSGGAEGTNCHALCNQANNFDASMDVNNLAFCQNSCLVQCVVYDSARNLRRLHEECP